MTRLPDDVAAGRSLSLGASASTNALLRELRGQHASYKMRSSASLPGFRDARDAVRHSCKPPQQTHINPAAVFEGRSTYERQYTAYDADAARKAIRDPVKPLGGTLAASKGAVMEGETAYRQEFGRFLDLQEARSERVKPLEGTLRIDPAARLGESKSTFTREYPLHGQHSLQNCRASIPRPSNYSHTPLIPTEGIAAIDGVTAYKEQFGTLPDTSGAIGPNFKPAYKVHVDLNSRSLVKKSASHSTFTTFDQEEVMKNRGARVKALSDTPDLITAKSSNALEGLSVLKEGFRGHYGAELRDAKPQNFKPPPQVHIDKHAALLFDKPISHTMFERYDPEVAAKSRGTPAQALADTRNPIAARGGVDALDGLSSYKAEYIGRDVRGARGPSCKPAIQVHINPDAKFMVSRTTFKREFPVHDAESAKQSRGQRVPPLKGAKNLISALDENETLAGDFETVYRSQFRPGMEAPEPSEGPRSWWETQVHKLHIDPNAKQLVTQTTSHATFAGHDPEQVRRFRGSRVQPPQDTENMITPHSRSKLDCVSCYTSSFTPLRY
eukprot:gnl/TRDRNA2_/TRDRNA2_132838_c0_seq1.p1 gnl/TRDRNA2_/TRDRNA2_132838_c0~~gnl/TRDRNA2_/TRDRNA2_132838_c0_seq1.p1  ORF type:complete len:555 (-),score=70.06 gnl/TRDRNA2_/TRDRNA2_132838_c0_seq1:200-1864(-)